MKEMIKQNFIFIGNSQFGIKKLKENEIEKEAFAILGGPITQGPRRRHFKIAYEKLPAIWTKLVSYNDMSHLFFMYA